MMMMMISIWYFHCIHIWHTQVNTMRIFHGCLFRMNTKVNSAFKKWTRIKVRCYLKKKQPYFQINVERKIHISIDKDVHCTLVQKTRFEFHYSHFKWQLFLWHNKYNKLKATTAAPATTSTTYNEKRGELL